MLNTSKSALIAAASIFAVSGFALAPSFAEQLGSIPSSSSSAIAAGTISSDDNTPAGLDKIRTASIAAASPVTVKRIDALENDEARQYENISADRLAATQQELQANPGLVSELQAQGVQLNNVVDIETFSNGGALVYVR
jgi:hypothetical protein